MSNQAEQGRKLEFDIMYHEFEEWAKTADAFKCVQASDFNEVWMTAYRAGMKAQRIAQIKAEILSAVPAAPTTDDDIPKEMARQRANYLRLKAEMVAAGVKFYDTNQEECSPEESSVCDIAERLRISGGDGFRSRLEYQFNGYMYLVDVELINSMKL